VRLDLRANRLTDDAVRALVKAAPPRLAWLDLRGNGLTAAGMRALLGSPLGDRLGGLELNAPDLDPSTVQDLVAWRSGRDLAQRRGGLPTRLTNALGMEFRLIPAGTFRMGSPRSEPAPEGNDGPQHEVTLTRPFYLGVYPVTQREYEAVMEHNPSSFTPERGGGTLDPVEDVSWEDCQAFCQRLSAREPGRKYRLPTEAEWEYACRAGAATPWCFGDDVGQLGEYAWFFLNADYRTHEVGTRRPNAWGLFDMHGNVCEWCADWYGDYSNGNQTDPKGANSGELRVLRGGSWWIECCRADYRNWNAPSERRAYYGLRVCFCLD
jgi:formylglycine-generating enzyme required for sulfatase activity